MAVLGYLAKLKRDLGLAFGVQFLHDFSIKMFLFLYQWTKFPCHNLLFLKIANKNIDSSYINLIEKSGHKL